MCDVCCKEFKGWCKSFTRTEAILSALEAALLIIFIAFLSFLILHFLVCKEPGSISKPSAPWTPGAYGASPESSTKASKFAKGKDCTWTPSAKTVASTRYFEANVSHNTLSYITKKTTTRKSRIGDVSEKYPVDDVTEIKIVVDNFDGEDPEPVYKSFVLALVKTRPQQDIVFGCILTIVSEYWTLTAASCIESIEEVDSLDSFVIMESYGELANGVTHAVADVQINPFYQGTNKSFDLAALKSDTSLVRRSGIPVMMPELLDYLLITIGERFTILGYGQFRTVTNKVLGRSLREVHVHNVPSWQCIGDADSWSPRHLWAGKPSGKGEAPGEGGAPLCVGPLYSRGVPCNYCAGTPLFDGRRLLGVMSGNAQCGVACEPVFYANVATSRDWLDSVVESD